jgi:hypothetical protein
MDRGKSVKMTFDFWEERKSSRVGDDKSGRSVGGCYVGENERKIRASVSVR